MNRRLVRQVWGGLLSAGCFAFVAASVPKLAFADDTPQVSVNDKGSGSSSGTALDGLLRG